MILFITSEAADNLVKIAGSGTFQEKRDVARAVALLKYIEVHDLKLTDIVNITETDGTRLFHVKSGKINLILAVQRDRPEKIVLVNVYPDSSRDGDTKEESAA
jgi:hypothetical protein